MLRNNQERGWLIILLLLAAACSSATSDPQDNDSTSTEPALTYYQDIQPIYQEHCGFCHAGCAPDACAGDTCFSTYYEALLYSSPYCDSQMNVAECGLYRIEYTVISDGPAHLKLTGKDKLPIIVPPDEIGKIALWIDQGMPIGPPPDSTISPDCVPDCSNKECGCDGCGGMCDGSCPEFFYCQHASGTCSIASGLNDAPRHNTDCIAKCKDKPCGGPNGCGGPCPIKCEGTCDPITNECKDCVPNCEEKDCGENGCGGICPNLCGSPRDCDITKNKCFD